MLGAFNQNMIKHSHNLPRVLSPQHHGSSSPLSIDYAYAYSIQSIVLCLGFH